MLVTDLQERSARAPDEDQRVVLHGVSWQDFERLLAIRGERAGVRMTYLEGELELMTPSRTHEGIKTTIGRILEAHAMARDLIIEGFGSWTLRNELRERGIEPDECYIVGTADKDRPDLAIEVIWTSGGIDKLDVYRGLGVPEVWLWRQGRIEVHVLHGDSYTRVETSGLLPDVDLTLAARCLLQAASQTEAVKTYLAALGR